MEFLSSWPFAVIVLGLAFLVLFRGAIASLLSRMKRAGRDGVDFSQPASQEEQAARNEDFETVMRLPISETVRAQETELQATLESMRPKDDKQRIQLLFRTLASMRVNGDFFWIHSHIYQSQMSLLGALIGRQTPMTRAEVEAHFDQAKLANPIFYSATDFQQWLQYLLMNGLLAEQGDCIDLTVRAKDFLKYLVDQRLAGTRPG